jgi:beta-phosphoglucomutase-like phosphatase (HAD superfamily)
MTLGTIIFALDGVVAETHEARREAFNDVFSEAGVGWHWDRACYAQLLRDSRGQELAASALIEAFLRERVVRPRHLGDLSNMIAAMERRHASLLRDRFAHRRVQLRAGIAPFLHAAAREGITLAIMARDDSENCRTLLETRLPAELSGAIEIIALKPHCDMKNGPSTYSNIATALDMDMRRCLVVESSAPSLAEARAAGIAGLMTWGLYPRMDDITSPRNLGLTTSIADAFSFLLNRWDCAPPRDLLSYIRDVHSMQCRLLYPSDIFSPASAFLQNEVNHVGLRHLEA